MNMNDYQDSAMKSVAITSKGVAALAHRSLGLSGESGILANTIKKIIRDKDAFPDESDRVAAKEKLGDALYYIAVLAEYFDLTLDDVAATNLEKSQAFLQNRNNDRS